MSVSYPHVPYPSIRLTPTLLIIFLPVLRSSPVRIIPPSLHTIPSSYQTNYKMFFSMYKVVQIWPGLIAAYVHTNQSRSYLNHLVLQFSSATIIPPLLHTRPTTNHPSCKMFFSQYQSLPLSLSFHHCCVPIQPRPTEAVKYFSPSTKVFPCQYHSTIALYPSFHLPPTLYNTFLPVLQFPLSVLFHHCSIPIFVVPLLQYKIGRTGNCDCKWLLSEYWSSRMFCRLAVSKPTNLSNNQTTNFSVASILIYCY